MLAHSPPRAVLFWAAAFVALAGASAYGEDGFERPPIEYSKATPDNIVSQLQARLDAGEITLTFDKDKGYLPALLEALRVPKESQTLVFSKTSLQRSRISPRTPRALYFNDDVYVGYCHAGEVLEVSAADPQLGTVFYSLQQREAAPAKLLRQTDNCLICHSSSRTEGIPGHVLRSLKVAQSGEPILSAGSKSVDYRTPIKDRWGGWYVTGTLGKQEHLGNLISTRVRSAANDQAETDVKALPADRVKLERYMTPHSDIVALMVLEHQTAMHNRLTKASFEARMAQHYRVEMNRALGQSEGASLESATRRIQSAADDLVDALLFVEEAAIEEPLSGDAGFAEVFTAQGPKDSRGRSLRDLDLQKRVFKHPCSYLIYSKCFDALPEELQERVWARLAAVLKGEDKSEKFAHLSAADRQAIVEILRETKSGLPENFP